MVTETTATLILLFALITFITHWLAWRARFFNWAPEKKENNPTALFTLVAAAFAVYLGISLVIAPYIAKAITYLCKECSSIVVISYLQLSIFSLITLLLFLISISNKSLVRSIWKMPSPQRTSIVSDLITGMLAWLISFPAVVLIGQLADLFIYYAFQVEHYEQLAVRYLKMTLESPVTFLIALFSIVIFAPIIEEFLFRGLLQTWLKAKLGRKAAILIASLSFSLFHLSDSQGIGNISLFISLFTLSCYLGFIYEKERSLFASIGLHMAFNAISTVRILLT